MTELILQHDLRSSHGFIAILSNSNEWQTIDDLVAICDEAGYYHARLSSHHRDMAEGYVKRCGQKHQVQLSLWDLGEKVSEELDDEWTEITSSDPGKPR